MRRIQLITALTAAAAVSALLAPAASAHSAAFTISCSRVSFSYTGFVSATTQVNEQVSIDGNVVVSKQFSFTGSSGSDSVAISVPAGTHTVSVHADWSVDGGGSFNQSQTLTCGQPLKHRHRHCNSGRGNGSEGDSSQLIKPGTGSRGTSPTVDCDPGASGTHDHGGD